MLHKYPIQHPGTPRPSRATHRLRRRLARRLQQQSRFQRQLVALRQISQTALMVHDLTRTLEEVVEVVTQVIGASRSSLLLLDQENQLRIKAHKGLPSEVAEKVVIQLGQGIAGTVAETGEPVLIPDIESDPRFGRKNAPAYRNSSAVCVPIRTSQRILGVLNVNDRRDGKPFDQEDLRLLEIVAGHAAMLIQNATLMANLGDTIRSLAATNRLTTAILDSISDGVIALGAGGEIRMTSGPCSRILGHPSSRTPTVLDEFFPVPEVRAQIHQLLDRTRIASSPQSALITLEGEGSNQRFLATQSIPMGPDSPESTEIVLVLKDITRDLEMAERKNEFMALLSHELNTPLTTVKTYVDLLLGNILGPLSQEQQEVLADVKEAIARLTQEIGKIYWAYRLEQSERPPDRIPIDLEEVIQQAIAWVKPEAEDAQIQFQIDTQPAAPPVLADAGSLEVAFRQLLHNATKFSPREGLVRLQVAPVLQQDGQQRLRVTIQDQGPGIPSWDWERIFQVFEQGESHLRRVHGGLGIGLSLARKAIQWNGGALYLEEGDGSGACFVLELDPAVEEA